MRPSIYRYKPEQNGPDFPLSDPGDSLTARSGRTEGDVIAEVQNERSLAGDGPGVDAEAGERGSPAQGKDSKRVSNLAQITGDRPIFTLSVAADLLGLHPRTLRIYEEKKLVIPARTGGNRRRYSQNDIQRFQYIRRLTSGGVNLEGVRIILDMANELTGLGGDPNAIIERNLQDQDEP